MYYEFAPYCNSKFDSTNTNMLARIQNAFAKGLNSSKSGKLPKYVIVVLDDDLISYLDYRYSDGIASLLGTWVEWLVKEFSELIDSRLKQIPAKCRNITPFMYWVKAPTHNFFTKDRNSMHVKFNLCLESVIKQQKGMRVIKLKEFWNSSDSHLVINDRITEIGMSAYWKAIDASFKYNAVRHDQYTAKQFATRVASHTNESNLKRSVVDDHGDVSSARHDLMHEFFDRHRNYAGSQREICEDQHVHDYHHNQRRPAVFHPRWVNDRYLLLRLHSH